MKKIAPEDFIESVKSGLFRFSDSTSSQFPMWTIENLTRIIIERVEFCIARNQAYVEKPDFDFDTHLHIYSDGIIFHNISTITVNHSILGIDVYLAFEDSVLSFKKFNSKKDLFDFTQPSYIPLDEAVNTGPIIWSIKIPSKEVVFVNYFPDAINPPPANRYSPEYSLNHLDGRRNSAAHYSAQNNVGYGQTGNMSVGIYSNGSEILVVDPWFDDVLVEMRGDDVENYIDLSEPATREEDAWKLDTYIKRNNFDYCGHIDCSVWRYECTDGQVQINEDEHEDVIRIPITGTVLTANHYYDTPETEPEFGRYCITRIKVN